MSPCISIGNGFVTVGGEVIKMDTARGVINFEWHSYCGPMPVSMRKGHEGEGKNLPHDHPFWGRVTRWCEQGMRVKDGWAIVDRVQVER